MTILYCVKINSGENILNKYIVIMMLFGTIINLYGVGVHAGTVIVNQATLSFEVLDTSYEIKSNKTKDVVDQILDVEVKWLDTQAVSVSDGTKSALLAFKVTNTGNGNDDFMLYAQNDLSDDFDVHDMHFIDKKKNTMKPRLELKADKSKVLFVLSDMPSLKKRYQNDTSKVILKAISKRGGSGVIGKIHPRKGIRGTDAIDGAKGGIGLAYGTYKIENNQGLIIKKRVLVHNAYGTHEPIKGAVLTYILKLSLPKGKNACAIKMVDMIPKHTKYVHQSIKLGSHILSDDYDKDQGAFDEKKNAIVVEVGCVQYPELKTITYSVILQ